MLKPDMNDADDVEGSVSLSHSFRHEINWGHVALGVALIYALYKIASLYSGATKSNGEDDNMKM